MGRTCIATMRDRTTPSTVLRNSLQAGSVQQPLLHFDRGGQRAPRKISHANRGELYGRFFQNGAFGQDFVVEQRWVVR